ncbi:MAG: tRNA (adenosine(37)-N6)-dimethylallyltransferase MiaA [Mariprofundaceae bacterium]|nr:tRNA (adenosine(37)-N6)-dimethylallyltransferase MiaA [Mariprofundaceae bacterium]
MTKNIQQPWRAMALMGATGTGKTTLALDVAKACGSVIISCDSMQLYRGLDIGTAKVSVEERGRISHHLIDCADISDVWSAQRWADAALEIIKQENKQDRIPLIVGGTGMYLRALVEGFAKIPEEKEGVRDYFVSLQAEQGTPYLHDLLKQCDPILAERLHNTDTQRIMRGLCIYKSTNIALSTWQAEQEAQKEKIDCPVFVLDVPRPVLRERLAKRIEMMMDAGWLDEVRWLKGQDITELHPALRAVGYRQLLMYLNEQCSREEAMRDAITATRKYAKRQVTWFRNQTPNAMLGDAEKLKQAMMEKMKVWT